MRALACIAIALPVAGAAGQVATLELVDPSGLEATAEFFTFVGSDATTGLADVIGTVEIEADDYDAPTALTLHAFAISTDPALSLAGMLDAGDILGGGTYSLRLDGIDFAGAAAVPDDGSGGPLFQFADAPTALRGETTATYDIIALDPVNLPIIVDLADLDTGSATLSDVSLTSDGTTVTMTGTLTLERFVVSYVTSLVETRIDAVVSITAQGPVPGGPCNAADLVEPFGLLDLADITAFLAAFTAQDPIADLVPDGLFDLADINAFIGAFNAGCP